MTRNQSNRDFQGRGKLLSCLVARAKIFAEDMAQPVLQLSGKMPRREDQREPDLDLESTEDDATDDFFSDESSFYGTENMFVALSMYHLLTELRRRRHESGF
jgi:hypothetical protein